MAVCFFLVALPASGKSTLVNKMLEEDPSLRVVSLDKYIEKKMVEENCDYNTVFRNKDWMADCESKYKKELTEIIENKENFIWDQMNIAANGRKRKINRLKSNKYEVICLEFNIPTDEWNARIAKRNKENPEKKFSMKFYQDIFNSLEPVKADEGFDDVFFVDVNGELKKKFSQGIDKKFK